MSGGVKHIAHALGWRAVCIQPDLCRVGKDVVAFNSHATLDNKVLASPDVKAQGTAVYREGDVFKSVQGDAGGHLISGTSLGSGHVKILEGHSNVKVNGKGVARHNSRCLINCNAAGAGGAQGKLVTEEKGGKSGSTPNNPEAPPGARTNERLERLRAARKALEANQLDLDALDEYVDFEQTNAVLDDLIGEIKGTPGTAGDVAAQAARGVLGFGKDVVTGVGELAYEGIKAVPKLARRQYTSGGQGISQLDSAILAENMRLGNVTPGTIGQTALDVGKAIVKPVTDPWSKDQYVESVVRGAAEIFTLPAGWTKAGRAAKAAKAAKAAEALKWADAAKSADVVKAAETAKATNGASATAVTTKTAAVSRKADAGQAKGGSGGVHIKKKTPKGGPKKKKINKPREPQAWEKRVVNEDGTITYTLKTKEGEPFVVTYRDGYPDLSEYVYDGPLGKGEVDIEMLGKNRPDFKAANTKAGFGDGPYSHPKGYIWHHHQNMKTMQLIRADIHRVVPHTGGVAGIRKEKP